MISSVSYNGNAPDFVASAARAIEAESDGSAAFDTGSGLGSFALPKKTNPKFQIPNPKSGIAIRSTLHSDYYAGIYPQDIEKRL
jgi:hypothetical protein